VPDELVTVLDRLTGQSSPPMSSLRHAADPSSTPADDRVRPRPQPTRSTRSRRRGWAAGWIVHRSARLRLQRLLKKWRGSAEMPQACPGDRHVSCYTTEAPTPPRCHRLARWWLTLLAQKPFRHRSDHREMRNIEKRRGRYLRTIHPATYTPAPPAAG